MTDELRIEGGDTTPQDWVIKMPSTKRWRCANGHEWVGEGWHISFDRRGEPPFHREFNCCVECMAEAFARIAVPVEEVKEAK